MKPTQTGIAVALALVVVALFIMNPALSPFSSQPDAQTAAVDMATDTAMAATTTSSNTAMPPTQPQEPITQLMTKDEVVGTGAAAAAGDTVTVNYVGSLTNGTIFDASAKHGTDGFTFKLGAGQVIQGWDQGIVGMKVGGKRLLAIPADMAYGDHAVGNVIPANSPLIFEVELLNVTK